MDVNGLYFALESYLQSYEVNFQTMLPTIVKQAEDRISKAVILPMNRKTVTLTYVNGTQTSALPVDFLAPFELRSVVTNEYTPVGYVDVSFMREAYPNPTVTGVPQFYSMFDSSTIIVAPTPNGTVSGYLHYFYKPQSITDSTDGTSWLGTNAENCLLYGCLSESYTYLKGEQDLMQLYETKFQAALNDLRTLGEGLDLGDAYRMGERRVPRRTNAATPTST